MENWITRIVATLCTMGSLSLFWVFGVFIIVPWRDGRMLSLDRAELQLFGTSLAIGLAVAWGAVHLYAIADRENNPRIHRLTRLVVIAACVSAMLGGMLWTQARIA